MSVKFSNNGHSTLAASLTDSATSITVASGHGARFPSLSSGEYFYATLIDASNNLEIVKVTGRSSDVLTATRAQESTTARAYAIGDRIELRVTAAGITDATNIDNIVPSQSGNSGKFLKTDGTNVSFAIAGSTDASDLSSGTLASARLPGGTVLQTICSYGIQNATTTITGSTSPGAQYGANRVGRTYGLAETINITCRSTSSKILCFAKVGWSSNAAHATGAHGAIITLNDTTSIDNSDYPWYSEAYVSYSASPYWVSDTVTGSFTAPSTSQLTIRLRPYVYRESGTKSMVYNYTNIIVQEVG